jgi:hypothetical protein
MLSHVYGDVGMSSSNRYDALTDDDDTMLTNSQIPVSNEVVLPIASTQATFSSVQAPETPNSKRAKRKATSPADELLSDEMCTSIERIVTMKIREATKSLRKEIDSLKNEITELKSRTASPPPFAPIATPALPTAPTHSATALATESLRQDCAIERTESYTRRNTVRFFGVDERQGEDTTTMCVDACRAMGLMIDRWEIDTSHRVGPRHDNKPRAIICKFIRRETKYKVIQHRNGLSKTQHWYNVRVHEDITRTRNRFMHQLKTVKNCIVTTRDGKVEVKRGSERSIIIDNLYESRSKLGWSEEALRSVFPRASRD